jgi:mannitol-specific phosphotransferase system IIBC component
MSVHDEFQSLIENCDAKRKALAAAGTRSAWWHRFLNFASGVLALVSTGSIAAAIAKLANNQTAFQVASLMLSFSSGIISLVLTQFFDQKSIEKMLELSVDFAGLREKLILEALKAERTKDEAKNLERLRVMQTEYNKLNRGFRLSKDSSRVRIEVSSKKSDAGGSSSDQKA